MKISVLGRQGLSPMLQKLSLVAMRIIFDSGKPAIFDHSDAASSSS
jgi:hypothetical protein